MRIVRGRLSLFVGSVAVSMTLVVTPAPAARAEGSPPAATPTTPSAEEVAAQVQSFYDQTKAVEAQFFQTYYSKLYDRYDKSGGAVKFQKPGKMRWDYAAPNGKVIASDGKQLVMFEPGENGEPGQMFERSISESELPQALAFLTGTGRLANDFSFRLLDPDKQGFKGGHVLELMPKKPSPHFDRILFYVDGDPKRAGLVHRVLIIDSAGNRNRIDFQAPKFNRPVADKTFAFQPPKGTRRIQQ